MEKMYNKFKTKGCKVVKKRLFSAFLILTLIISMFAGIQVPTFAEDGNIDGFNYSIVNGEACINYYNGPLTDVVIPSTINGYPVTSINNIATSSTSDNIVSLTIPAGVKSIGTTSLWAYCKQLQQFIVDEANQYYKSINGVLFNITGEILIAYPKKNARTEYTIPDSVTTISSYSFYRCNNLVSITFGSGVKQINTYAFFGCSTLSSVSISNSLYRIYDYAFLDCINLNNLILPEGLKYIGTYAFKNCTSLSQVTFPNSLVSIGIHAFNNCTALTSIAIPSNVKKIDSYTFYG